MINYGTELEKLYRLAVEQKEVVVAVDVLGRIKNEQDQESCKVRPSAEISGAVLKS